MSTGDDVPPSADPTAVPAPTGPPVTGRLMLGELDVLLAAEGRHQRLYEHLGAHPATVEGVDGVAFAVWAPNASGVAVVGDWNAWDGAAAPMERVGESGLWEAFAPGAAVGHHYKFAVAGPDGQVVLHADPFAFETEHPPETASVVNRSSHGWADAEWMAERGRTNAIHAPMSVYEVHLDSWRRDPARPDEPLDYRTLADELADYVEDLGFTHVELLPIMGHPFAGSWGYQVTSYFAPTPRMGTPDDLRLLIDRLHQRGIGVILDWVPAHFPRDAWALARFDGTALFEHEDPRRGAHQDWGTLIFNVGRNEVRNFLVASALYWTREFHADGLRVDAVASMLYLDYSRAEGEWVPNRFGGREDLDSVAFLKELNETVYAAEPGIVTLAEESTAWPGVSRPTYVGGLGFGFKWNMGWMHDTLAYFGEDPIHRRYHHHELTHTIDYAFSEHYVLPLSHDEVVHGKGSLLTRMPGDRWQQLANLRAMLAHMWGHPGKKLLFMGCEFGQEREWDHETSLDWHLLEDRAHDGAPTHSGVQALVRDLNRTLRAHPALWRGDGEPEGFLWLEPNDGDHNVVAYLRRDTAADPAPPVVCVANLSPIPREGYRVGLPSGGTWREVLNSDASQFGGVGMGNGGSVAADDVPWHGQPSSAALVLPPLGVLWLAPDDPAAAPDGPPA